MSSKDTGYQASKEASVETNPRVIILNVFLKNDTENLPSPPKVRSIRSSLKQSRTMAMHLSFMMSPQELSAAKQSLDLHQANPLIQAQLGTAPSHSPDFFCSEARLVGHHL